MGRLLIIGSPGSGKSTLARELAQLTGLPLVHLDMLYWNPDRTRVERDIFLDRLHKALEGDRWIIDGNYISTMDMRMDYCQTIIFLDYPVEVCLEGIANRVGTIRTDIPWVETELDLEFSQYVQGFQQEVRPRVLELLEKHREKEIHIFRDRNQTQVFLEKFKKEN